MAEFDKKLIEERKRRLAERKEKRKEERKAKFYREKEEEAQRKRDEELKRRKCLISRIETDRLTHRMGSEPNLSVKWSITIHTM